MPNANTQKKAAAAEEPPIKMYLRKMAFGTTKSYLTVAYSYFCFAQKGQPAISGMVIVKAWHTREHAMRKVRRVVAAEHGLIIPFWRH